MFVKNIAVVFILYQTLNGLQGKHLLGNRRLNLLFQNLQQTGADEVFPGHQDNLTGRPRDSKRTDQFFLLFAQLHHCQFRNKRNPLTTLHHMHKGFHTTQPIRHLADLNRFHLTKTNQLIAEAMPFVKKPKPFPCHIGRTNHIVLEQRFLL